jgi:hypothetical protein
MARNKNWKSWVILGAAAITMLSSGAVVIASNFGFKMNRAVWSRFALAQTPKRENWVSVPYNSYANPKEVCNALGTTALQVSVAKFNPLTGLFTDGQGETGFAFTCNGAGPGCAVGQTCVPLPTHVGLRIRDTRTNVGDSLGVYGGILVGSSDETKALPNIYGQFLAGGAPKKENWISVPYHTTWIKAADVCTTFGIAGLGLGSVSRYNADPAATTVTTYSCTGATNNFSLVIGEAIIVRKNTPTTANQGNGNCGPNVCIGGTNAGTVCTGNPGACLGGGTCSTGLRDLCGVLPPHF